MEDLAIGFSASAPTLFPGAYYTNRRANDPAGTIDSSGVLRQGVDYYVRTFGTGSNRWGDYSGISVDPTDDMSFWVFNEYALARGTIFGGEDGRWGTAFGHFSLQPPACTAPSTGNWIISENCGLESSVTAPANVIVNENVTLTIASGIRLDIDFSSYHLSIKNGAKVVIKAGGKIY
jgi:hypothetical protein